jgi:hypothetical protein
MSTNKNNSVNPAQPKKDNTKEILEKDISVTETEPDVIENPEPLKKVDEPATIRNPEPPKPAETIIGIVTNCIRLNVRETPIISAKILSEVDVNSKLMIDETESTEEWFKVYTETGIEGFCMKKFITISK